MDAKFVIRWKSFFQDGLCSLECSDPRSSPARERQGHDEQQEKGQTDVCLEGGEDNHENTKLQKDQSWISRSWAIRW